MDWNGPDWNGPDRNGPDRNGPQDGDGGEDGATRRPRIPERLMRLLAAEPFVPIRVFAGGWVWELRFREAMVISGPGSLRLLARRPGHPDWIDLELRAAQILAIEVDSTLFDPQDWSVRPEAP